MQHFHKRSKIELFIHPTVQRQHNQHRVHQNLHHPNLHWLPQNQ